MGMAKVVVLWTYLEVDKSCFTAFFSAVHKTLQSYGAFVNHTVQQSTPSKLDVVCFNYFTVDLHKAVEHIKKSRVYLTSVCNFLHSHLKTYQLNGPVRMDVPYCLLACVLT